MNTTMRTTGDRIRHTLFYEIILIVTCVPFLSWTLHKPMEKLGALSIVMSLMAMGWNYLYNILFDHALLRLGKPLYPRSLDMRIGHALLFELGLMTVTIPTIMRWLHFSFAKALMFDLAFLVIVPIYTVFYNGIYDRIFPVKFAPIDKQRLKRDTVGAQG